MNCTKPAGGWQSCCKRFCKDRIAPRKFAERRTFVRPGHAEACLSILAGTPLAQPTPRVSSRAGRGISRLVKHHTNQDKQDRMRGPSPLTRSARRAARNVSSIHPQRSLNKENPPVINRRVLESRLGSALAPDPARKRDQLFFVIVLSHSDFSCAY